MSILSEIVRHKRSEIKNRRNLIDFRDFEKTICFSNTVKSMKQAMLQPNRPGIIAEIKRGSPSVGIINQQIDVAALSRSYIEAGASALSILTDEKYFKGSIGDLEAARKVNDCPILRKDFIVDEYQLLESKSIGADCILLIAACLKPDECERLANFAKELGLEVLLEIHNEAELLSHLSDSIDIVGVNNRNLNDFTTDINTSLNLANKIPSGIPKISESGISSIAQIKQLQRKGFNGFLIGTTFMKTVDPGFTCKEFISQLGQVDL